MSFSVVIIGDSPLSFLIARQLDNELARQAHTEVTLIRRDPKLIYWPDLTSLLAPQTHFAAAKLMKDVDVKVTTVKQINLADRRVITGNGTLNFDLLIIDSTPMFSAAEVNKIADQCRRLVNEIKAKVNTGQTKQLRLTFTSADSQSWQLALAFRRDLTAQPTSLQRLIKVQAEFPQNQTIASFFKENGIVSRKSVEPLPGLTIGSPSGQ